MSYIDSLALRLKRSERFKELVFAPISNRITIEGEHLTIPLMEIQSNALNMFLHGDVGPKGLTDLWLTFPLDNIRKNESSLLMKKRGYAAIKGKVHLHMYSNELGVYSYKFRTSKRKFYKKRGVSQQFRIDRKAFRLQRKKMMK